MTFNTDIPYNSKTDNEATHKVAGLGVYIAFDGSTWCWMDQEQCPDCGGAEFTLTKRNYDLFMVCDTCHEEYKVTPV